MNQNRKKCLGLRYITFLMFTKVVLALVFMTHSHNVVTNHKKRNFSFYLMDTFVFSEKSSPT